MCQVIFYMNKIPTSLPNFLEISKIHTILSRELDGRIGAGLGWTEFVILHTIATSPGQKMRRIDLAAALGMTASGITRQLLPMEKVGYIKKETTTEDARVSLVTLGNSAEERLTDAYERLELYFNEKKNDEIFTKFLK